MPTITICEHDTHWVDLSRAKLVRLLPMTPIGEGRQEVFFETWMILKSQPGQRKKKLPFRWIVHEPGTDPKPG